MTRVRRALGARAKEVRAFAGLSSRRGIYAVLVRAAGLCPLAVQAQRAVLLRAGFAFMPREALDQSRFDMFFLVDVQALLGAGGFPFNSFAMSRVSYGRIHRARGGVALWRAGAVQSRPGVTLDEIAAFSGQEQRLEGVAQWHFSAPDMAETLMEALKVGAGPQRARRSERLSRDLSPMRLKVFSRCRHFWQGSLPMWASRLVLAGAPEPDGSG